MEKTNFTFVPALRWMLMSMLLIVGYGMSAQTMTCNNGIQVSVEPAANVCQIEITADMVLEGDPTAPAYDLHLVNGITTVYNGAAPAVIQNVQGYFGSTLTVTITDPASGNSCWGSVVIEDKIGPVVTCTDLSINCDQDLPGIGSGVSAVDNCDLTPDIQMTDEVYTDQDICDDDEKEVVRTYVAFDEWGNESAPCTQVITIDRIDPIFPSDVEIDCGAYAANNALTTPPFSGHPFNVNGDFEACNYAVSYDDQILSTCGFAASTSEPVFKIVRVWTVLDWCTSQVILIDQNGGDNVQVIKVIDDEAPVINMMPITVSANVPGSHPHPCTSTDFVPAPGVLTDNCTGVVSLSIFTDAGELNYVGGNAFNGGFIPAPGLTVGTHTVTYVATDACGNQSEFNATLNVIDDIAPVAICDEITDVNLSSDGLAVVYASVFDDGSHDQCCLDDFQVRRMTDNCGIAGNTAWGDHVTFCCEDIDASPIMVSFRAWDCYGNYNDCMVEVYVQDKINPWVNCPGPASITCDDYYDNYKTALELGNYSVLDGFGDATYWDNCEAIVTTNVTVNIDNCGDGTITRSWSVTDPSENGPATCSQTIFVSHVSDFEVEFPADMDATCEEGAPGFGEPILYFETCELLATSYEDEVFTNVPDACYKIVRQWTVINWCTVEDVPGIADELPDPQVGPRRFRDGGDGYITYQQVIKVNDEVCSCI